jgi:hypothetical protein
MGKPNLEALIGLLDKIMDTYGQSLDQNEQLDRNEFNYIVKFKNYLNKKNFLFCRNNEEFRGLLLNIIRIAIKYPISDYNKETNLSQVVTRANLAYNTNYKIRPVYHSTLTGPSNPDYATIANTRKNVYDLVKNRGNTGYDVVRPREHIYELTTPSISPSSRLIGNYPQTHLYEIINKGRRSSTKKLQSPKPPTLPPRRSSGSKKHTGGGRKKTMKRFSIKKRTLKRGGIGTIIYNPNNLPSPQRIPVTEGLYGDISSIRRKKEEERQVAEESYRQELLKKPSTFSRKRHH